MTGWRLRRVDMGEVATVAVGGWLAGTAIFGVGFSVVAVVAVLREAGWATMLMMPQLLFLVLFGAGLLSVPFVLPTALLLAALLRTLGVARYGGAAICFAVGCAYALGLAGLPSDWQWWADFWYAAPIYGAAMGFVYLRTIDA